MPITGHCNFFTREPPAVFQSALANDGLQPGHPEISTQREVVLPGSDEYDVPFLIEHPNLRSATRGSFCLYHCKKVFRYSAIFSPNAFLSISTIPTISILS